MNPLFRAILVGALVCAVAVASGQEPQQPAPPTFRTGIDLVRVDVSVIGRDAEMVTDLEASDFIVEEDGIPVKVETLQFVRLDGTRTSDTDESLEIRSPEHAAREAAREDVRLFAIFMDDYHVDKMLAITAVARRALKDLVQHFGPNDLIAVVDPLTPLSHIKFTRSRNELLERVEKFEGRRGQIFPVRSVMEEAQLREPNVWELRGGVSLSALAAIVTHLGGLREGRKSVVFLSQGPPLGRLGGPNEDRLNEVLQAANRGNVTVHVIDPRPLGQAPLGGPDVLFRLYNETGGRAIINSNNPSQRLGEIIADASAYYLLGYTPSRAFADGKFHRIEVKVNRRGTRVLARRGYWAPTEKEKTFEPAGPTEPGLREALSQLPHSRSARPLDVWIGLSRGADAHTRVSVTWEPIASRDAKHRATRLTVERLRGRQGNGAADERYVIGATNTKAESALAAFDVPGGTELTLRFTAATDEDTVLDQWDQTLRVDAFDSSVLALSTPRFLRARSAFEAQAMRAGQDPAPAASRQFRPTDLVFVEVDCYSPADASATVSALLLNGNGEPLTILAVPPPVGGKARFSLPLSSLAPSTYVLRLDARTADHDVQQRAAFRVVP